MAEALHIDKSLPKAARYSALLPQLKALVADEPNTIANMANISAALRETFGFLWVGFYVVHGAELVLGPFQGPIACTRIAYGKGVCGAAWANKEILVVPDVDKFPGHIACSSFSKSEIVVPVFRDGDVIALLDVDSESLHTFDKTDSDYLEKIAAML